MEGFRKTLLAIIIYSAGMSFLDVKSPDAPKMTNAVLIFVSPN